MSDPKTIEVVVEALRQEATMWGAQGEVLRRISGAAAGLRMTGWEAGIFAPVVGACESARTQIETWCGEGATNVVAVADELRRNATAYETTEVDVTATVEGAY